MRTDAEAMVGLPGTRRLSLSVVIPTDGDGARLADCLAALASAPRRGIDLEILVVDAGDSAGTRATAEAAGAVVLSVAGTRGARSAAGRWPSVGAPAPCTMCARLQESQARNLGAPQG